MSVIFSLFLVMLKNCCSLFCSFRNWVVLFKWQTGSWLLANSMSCSKEIYLTHSSGKTHIINRIPNNVNSLQQTQSPFPAPFITLPPRRTCFHILISPKGGLFVWQPSVSSFLWGAVTTSAGSGGLADRMSGTSLSPAVRPRYLPFRPTPCAQAEA